MTSLRGGYELHGQGILHDSELQRSGSMEQFGTESEVNGRCVAKVAKQGREVIPNNGKALCLLARDYKGFGNQQMNGVIERYDASTRGN